MHCAGIIPYDIKAKKILLGKSKYEEWSSFSGKSKQSETIWETAQREFHEETAGMFDKSFIKKHIDKKIFKSSTPSGMNIYLYFISVDSSSDHKKLFEFLRSISVSNDSKEMTEVEWIDFNAITSNSLRMRYAFFKDSLNIIKFLVSNFKYQN